MLNNDQSQLNHTYTVGFANEELLLLGGGAIFWPTQKLLIVADLHLEKGSYFASCGNLLPHYDTRDTLQRLEKLIATYKPEKIICLGDNFHDQAAIKRMALTDYKHLCQLNRQLEWLWIIGNHDKGIPADLLKSFYFQHTCVINGILFTHEFIPQQPLQIVGHFHPKMTINIHGKIMKGKCFIVGQQTLVMPAFGSYTGGLDIYTTVFRKILGDQDKKYFFIKNNRVWKIKAKM